MSKIIFVYDHRFTRDPKSLLVYSGGVLGRRTWEPLLEVFDQVIVVARGKEYHSTLKTKNLRLSSCPGVEFFLWTTKKTSWSDGGLLDARAVLKHELAMGAKVIFRLPSISSVLCGLGVGSTPKNLMVEIVGHPFDALWHRGGLLPRVLAGPLWAYTRYFASRSHFARYVTKKALQRILPNRLARSVNVTDAELSFVTAVNGSTSKKVKIGMIGNIDAKYKGVSVLIEAARILAEIKRVEFDLEIVGPGEPFKYEKKIKNYNLQHSIRFIGPINRTERLIRWMDSLTLYVQPSLTEGLPRALLEAIARGIPCVGSAVGGIPEVLPDWACVKPGCPHDLANRIAWMLRNRSEALQGASDALRNLRVEVSGRKSKIREILESLKNA